MSANNFEDFFTTHYKISSIFLLIPPNTNSYLKALFWIIAVPHFILICLSAFLESAMVVLGTEIFSVKILNVGISALHLMAVNRVSKWLFVKPKYDKVLEKLREFHHSLSNFDFGPINSKKINAYLKIQMLQTRKDGLYLTLGYLFYVSLNIPTSYTFNYLSPPVERWNAKLNKTSIYRDYPYPLWYPFDTSISDGYYLLGFIYQPYAFWFLMCAFFCIDSLCVSTIMHLTSFINILGYTFTCIDKDINDDDRLNYTEIMVEKERRFTKCVKLLQDIYHCCDMLNEVFSSQLLIQESFMATLICCTLYRVTSNLPAAEISYLSTMIVVAATEMFIVAYFNQNFTLEAFKLLQRIYELDWINYNVKLRRMIVFLLQRVQKPFYFTMGLGIPLDIGVFLTMIKSSYSFYTLITQNDQK